MAYILTIDRGNSATKVDVWQEDKLLTQKLLKTPNPAAFKRVVERYGITRAIYCSVADDGSEMTALLADLGVEVLILRPDTPTPLAIDYATPATLGVDRLAAAVGAWSKFPGAEILVVDLGTAITYDRVTPDARYIGGNIAPGVTMRLKALSAFTARLPHIPIDGDNPMWGYDTATALRSGALHGIVGELSYYRSLLTPSVKVVLTGGTSPRIFPLLDFEVSLDPHLVTRGLNAILNFNTTTDNHISSDETQ